jgi:hypothetical protein
MAASFFFSLLDFHSSFFFSFLLSFHSFFHSFFHLSFLPSFFHLLSAASPSSGQAVATPLLVLFRLLSLSLSSHSFRAYSASSLSFLFFTSAHPTYPIPFINPFFSFNQPSLPSLSFSFHPPFTLLSPSFRHLLRAPSSNSIGSIHTHHLASITLPIALSLSLLFLFPFPITFFTPLRFPIFSFSSLFFIFPVSPFLPPSLPFLHFFYFFPPDISRSVPFLLAPHIIASTTHNNNPRLTKVGL